MPLIETIYPDNDTVIGLWHMTETEDELLALLQNTHLYMAELGRFTSAKRRLEYLSVRVMLQKLLGTSVTVGYEPAGRPFLQNASFQLSISHTKDYAVVILHPNRRVAIDIERRAPKVMRLQHKFMNDHELAAVDQTDPLGYTLIAWSAKESLFKMIGKEGVDFKEHLLLDCYGADSAGSFIGSYQDNGTRINYTLRFLNTPLFVLTWI